MKPEELEKLKYPVGKHDSKQDFSKEQTLAHIQAIEELPARLRKAVADLNDNQLDKPYRPEGWKVKQVIHHLADSHMNAFVRMRLALTEEKPTIKPYEEGEWAKLEDSLNAPIEWSLQLLDSLHARWTMMLKSLSPEQLQRVYIHPVMGELRMDQVLGLYAWHSRHHTAHITHLRERMGW
jgi:DinB superfamily